MFFRNATGYEGVSNGFCRGCLSGGVSWPRLEVAHPPPDTNYCIASSASGCPIELSSPYLPPSLPLRSTSVLRTYPRATNHPSQSQSFSNRSTLPPATLLSNFSPHQPTPLGVTESPIRYQNNSHLFVVRPATPSFRVAIMKCRRMQ